MGTIIKKKIKNINYYYYVESKRINGKPKLVNQKYLGTAEKVLAKALKAENSLQKRVLYSDECEFGAVALLYDIAARIGLTGLIDKHCPKRNQGASVGEYILIEAINRSVAPLSTVNLEKWYTGTCLPKITGLKPSLFTAQNFWNNTDITEETLQDIEDDILKTIIDRYHIDTSHIIYDATNFFTYIDTMQPSEIARRGYSKEKRNDLRIVGLSLMVSPDCAIPLIHETYPGNRADSKQFSIMMNELKARYEKITGKSSDVTVIFDRGNNSESNIDILENEEVSFHYVGGLKRSQSGELYDIPKSSYIAFEEESLTGQSSYRMKMTAFGREVTAIIVYNPKLKEGQLQGININKKITAQKLQEIQQKLLLRSLEKTAKGRKPTVESVIASVTAILKTEFMTEVFSYKVLEEDGHIILTFAEDEEAFQKLCERELGKTVLFTDREDFSDAQIVTAYRSAWNVESSFRQMKDTEHLTVRPIFHWTDRRIKVHIFSCIQAYRLCCLLRKELHKNGIDISINRMLDEAALLRKVSTFFGDISSPEKVESFTLGSEISDKLDELFHLKDKYC